LIGHMQELLRNPALARELGAQGRQRANQRFNIQRFVADWNAALAEVTAMQNKPACA